MGVRPERDFTVKMWLPESEVGSAWIKGASVDRINRSVRFIVDVVE